MTDSPPPTTTTRTITPIKHIFTTPTPDRLKVFFSSTYRKFNKEKTHYRPIVTTDNQMASVPSSDVDRDAFIISDQPSPADISVAEEDVSNAKKVNGGHTRLDRDASDHANADDTAEDEEEVDGNDDDDDVEAKEEENSVGEEGDENVAVSKKPKNDFVLEFDASEFKKPKKKKLLKKKATTAATASTDANVGGGCESPSSLNIAVTTAKKKKVSSSRRSSVSSASGAIAPSGAGHKRVGSTSDAENGGGGAVAAAEVPLLSDVASPSSASGLAPLTAAKVNVGSNSRKSRDEIAMEVATQRLVNRRKGIKEKAAVTMDETDEAAACLVEGGGGGVDSIVMPHQRKRDYKRIEADHDPHWVYHGPPNNQRTLLFSEDWPPPSWAIAGGRAGASAANRAAGAEDQHFPLVYDGGASKFIVLSFSSEFDSGNLIQVERVAPYTYNLHCSPDCGNSPVQTNNKQWFHFSVRGLPKGIAIKCTMVGVANSKMYTYGWVPVSATVPMTNDTRNFLLKANGIQKATSNNNKTMGAAADGGGANAAQAAEEQTVAPSSSSSGGGIMGGAFEGGASTDSIEAILTGGGEGLASSSPSPLDNTFYSYTSTSVRRIIAAAKLIKDPIAEAAEAVILGTSSPSSSSPFTADTYLNALAAGDAPILYARMPVRDAKAVVTSVNDPIIVPGYPSLVYKPVVNKFKSDDDDGGGEEGGEGNGMTDEDVERFKQRLIDKADVTGEGGAIIANENIEGSATSVRVAELVAKTRGVTIVPLSPHRREAGGDGKGRGGAYRFTRQQENAADTARSLQEENEEQDVEQQGEDLLLSSPLTGAESRTVPAGAEVDASNPIDATTAEEEAGEGGVFSFVDEEQEGAEEGNGAMAVGDDATKDFSEGDGEGDESNADEDSAVTPANGTPPPSSEATASSLPSAATLKDVKGRSSSTSSTSGAKRGVGSSSAGNVRLKKTVIAKKSTTATTDANTSAAAKPDKYPASYIISFDVSSEVDIPFVPTSETEREALAIVIKRFMRYCTKHSTTTTMSTASTVMNTTQPLPLNVAAAAAAYSANNNCSPSTSPSQQSPTLGAITTAAVASVTAEPPSLDTAPSNAFQQQQQHQQQGSVGREARENSSSSAASSAIDVLLKAALSRPMSPFPQGHPKCPALFVAGNHPYSFGRMCRHLLQWRNGVLKHNEGLAMYMDDGCVATVSEGNTNNSNNDGDGDSRPSTPTPPPVVLCPTTGKAIPTNNGIYFNEEVLCKSLDGHDVHLLTITGISRRVKVGPREDVIATVTMGDRRGGVAAGLKEETVPCRGTRPLTFPNKKHIVISARIHPGETPASYMLHGALDFILHPTDPRALRLRKECVIMIVPIINPDGTQRGHSRADTTGQNLNRCYRDPSFTKHPSPFGVRNLLLYLQQRGRLHLYLDLHAHANKKGTFAYGNSMESVSMVQNLLYAKLVAMNSPYFEFPACNFSENNMFAVGKTGEGKDCSSRVTIYQDTGFVHSYTVEANYVAAAALNPVIGIPSLAANNHTITYTKGQLFVPPSALVSAAASSLSPAAAQVAVFTGIQPSNVTAAVSGGTSAVTASSTTTTQQKDPLVPPPPPTLDGVTNNCTATAAAAVASSPLLIAGGGANNTAQSALLNKKSMIAPGLFVIGSNTPLAEHNDVPPTGAAVPTRYSPATHADVGRGLVLGFMDLHNMQPEGYSRVAMSSFKNNKAVGNAIGRYIMTDVVDAMRRQVMFRCGMSHKEFFAAIKASSTSSSSSTPLLDSTAINKSKLSLLPTDMPTCYTAKGTRTFPPTTIFMLGNLATKFIANPSSAWGDNAASNTTTSPSSSKEPFDPDTVLWNSFSSTTGENTLPHGFVAGGGGVESPAAPSSTLVGITTAGGGGGSSFSLGARKASGGPLTMGRSGGLAEGAAGKAAGGDGGRSSRAHSGAHQSSTTVSSKNANTNAAPPPMCVVPVAGRRRDVNAATTATPTAATGKEYASLAVTGSAVTPVKEKGTIAAAVGAAVGANGDAVADVASTKVGRRRSSVSALTLTIGEGGTSATIVGKKEKDETEEVAAVKPSSAAPKLSSSSSATTTTAPSSKKSGAEKPHVAPSSSSSSSLPAVAGLGTRGGASGRSGSQSQPSSARKASSSCEQLPPAAGGNAATGDGVESSSTPPSLVKRLVSTSLASVAVAPATATATAKKDSAGANSAKPSGDEKKEKKEKQTSSSSSTPASVKPSVGTASTAKTSAKTSSSGTSKSSSTAAGAAKTKK